MNHFLAPVAVIFLALLTLAFNAAFAADEDNTGAEIIAIKTLTMGTVKFDHREHQDQLKDCQICHQYYPRQPGVIIQKKQQGVAPGTFMEKCRGCHATMHKGPTETCEQCHHLR